MLDMPLERQAERILRSPRRVPGLPRVLGLLLLSVGAVAGACSPHEAPPTRAEGTPSTPRDATPRDATPQNSAADSAGAPASVYLERTPSLGGTGKVYMGREIARTLSVHGIPWLERSEREDEEAPDRLVAALDLDADDVVADVGAGSGYFSRRLARRVPEGRVLAVDIQQGMLDALIEDAKLRGLTNLEPVLGAVDDPRLPEDTVDLALLVDAYHEFTYPREMMQGLLAALAPDGQLVLVEYRDEDPDSPIHPLHRMTEAQVRREMAAVVGPDGARLEHVDTLDVLPGQHIIVFRRVGGAS